MEPLRNELHDNSTTDGKSSGTVVNRGYFRIRPLNSKLTLELKGEFDRDNIKGISELIKEAKVLNKKAVELNMSAVQSINMQAMALLILTLKTLKENGMDVAVTGLCEEKLTVAYQFVMQCISQIL